MSQFDTFPSGQERKKLIERNKSNISVFKKEGRKRILVDGHYGWTDSPLEDKDRGNSFYFSFEEVLPKGEKSFKNYIEKTLAEKKGKALGIEFGGIGTNLFSGFTPGFFRQSLGVSLIDHRESSILNIVKKLDKQINHNFIEGDIYSPETYNVINRKVSGQKVDLIIERMAKGLEFTPIEPYAVSKILQIWYKLLSEGGVMFIQVPIAFNNILEVWVNKIKKEFNNVLEIQFTIGGSDKTSYCSSFRLKKLPGAPEDLPLLDPRVVAKTPKFKKKPKSKWSGGLF